MIIQTWLPLTGRLISREGGGQGDPASPVRFPPILDDAPLQGDETVTIRWLLPDWDSGQVYVEIEAPQHILDWLKAEYGLAAARVLLSQEKRMGLLAKLGVKGMEG